MIWRRLGIGVEEVVEVLICVMLEVCGISVDGGG